MKINKDITAEELLAMTNEERSAIDAYNFNSISGEDYAENEGRTK